MVVAALGAPRQQRFAENEVMVMIFKPTIFPFKLHVISCLQSSSVPPSEELWLQAYRADDLHPVLSFPTRAYRLSSVVGVRRTAWNSRQAQ
ncbi:hypothetical protein E3N88_29233 [Mikania micrantha]|uniref:Uncharacterized protein n=1 Tax=Mikania micrantha TaxID=192012 RepID=A0A5N6MIA3_9ASTR|nr:hypothetical protein E3N88_29233 [Mikania micrantha]